jgi:hypothetical protein
VVDTTVVEHAGCVALVYTPIWKVNGIGIHNIGHARCEPCSP